MIEKKWISQTREEVLETYVLTMDGLSSDRVAASRLHYGVNQLEMKKEKSALSRFIFQFKDPLILILFGASVLSMFIGDFIEASIILAIVFLNAVIGFIQEGKANDALKALQEMSSPNSKVIRNGKEESVPSYDVVMGDLVILEAGDLVPADLRLIQSSSLKIQEASLTGESEPADKDAAYIGSHTDGIGDCKNMAYASGMVTYGRGCGVVVGIGMGTEVGKIAQMLQASDAKQTPLQRKLESLGKKLGLVALVACGFIFVITILNQGATVLEAFMVAVSLAVAVIPEGLPAISTIVLAIGVNRLVAKNAIIRTLPSVETLGSATVICSDKTGTLTQNKMTVVDAWFDDNKTAREWLITGLALCNDSRLIDGNWVGDPTETALSEWVMHEGYTIETLINDSRRINEVPFDSERKCMTTIHEIDGKIIAFTKGGVDEVLGKTAYYGMNHQNRTITDADINTIQAAHQAMAAKALRVLALSIRELSDNPDEGDASVESGLTFVGLVGMIDPPRDAVFEAIKTTKNAGIRTVMITGDHAVTAEAIAREIGLLEDYRVVTGIELMEMSDDDLFNQVRDISVYARVSPEDKMRIIKAWKRNGEIVAMTGDGVNDAPALKMADIGAAMGITGTEVAKDASDMILTDDNFATIVTAVQEGRRIQDNIMKAVNYLLSCNVGELFTILIASLLSLGQPLLTIHILCINLITDSLPALALGVEPEEAGIMKRKAEKNQNILTRKNAVRILYQGIFISFITVCAYAYGAGFIMNQNGSEALGQTMAFAVLAFAQLVHAYNVRSPKRSVFKTFYTNKWLVGATLLNAAMVAAALLVPVIQEVLHLIPMTGLQWGIVVVLSLLPLPFVELMKVLNIDRGEN